jgi:hypothetical protein
MGDASKQTAGGSSEAGHSNSGVAAAGNSFMGELFKYIATAPEVYVTRRKPVNLLAGWDERKYVD